MRRLAFTILSTLSLLLCVAVGVLWGRSYWTCDIIERGGTHRLAIASNRGEVSLSRHDVTKTGPLPLGPTYTSVDAYVRPSGTPSGDPGETMRFDRAGFVLLATNGGTSALSSVSSKSAADDDPYGLDISVTIQQTIFSPGWWVAVPHWFLMVVLAMAGTARWYWRRRPVAGHCPTCGYDMRATPDRCPECGGIAGV